MLNKIFDIIALTLITIIFTSVGIVIIGLNLGFEKTFKIFILLTILSTMLAWEYRDIDCLKEW